MNEELRAKKAREKQSEVQVDMSRSSGSSHGAFSKILFRDKGRKNDLAIFKIASTHCTERNVFSIFFLT